MKTIQCSLDQTLGQSKESLHIANKFQIHLKSQDNDIEHIRNKIQSESERTDKKCTIIHMDMENLQGKLDVFRVDQDNRVDSLNNEFHSKLEYYAHISDLHELGMGYDLILSEQKEQLLQLNCCVDDLTLELSMQKDVNKSNEAKFLEVNKELARLKNEIFRVSYKQENSSAP